MQPPLLPKRRPCPAIPLPAAALRLSTSPSAGGVPAVSSILLILLFCFKMKGFRRSGGGGFSPKTGFPPTSRPPAGRRAEPLRAADASWQNLQEKNYYPRRKPNLPQQEPPTPAAPCCLLLPKGKQRSDLEETHHTSSSSGMPQPLHRGCQRAQARGKLFQ